MTIEERRFVNNIKKVYKIDEIIFKNGKIILQGPKIGMNQRYYKALNINNLKNGKELRKDFTNIEDARKFMQD